MVSQRLPMSMDTLDRRAEPTVRTTTPRGTAFPPLTGMSPSHQSTTRLAWESVPPPCRTASAPAPGTRRPTFTDSPRELCKSTLAHVNNTRLRLALDIVRWTVTNAAVVFAFIAADRLCWR